MDHMDVFNRIKEWLATENWGFNSNDDNTEVYLSLTSAETGLTAHIQVRLFDDGWYRVFAIWPENIESNMDNIIEYVTKCSSENFEYGRLKISDERKNIYYVSNVYINSLDELTDQILEETITQTAVTLVEKHGPEIVDILANNM